MSDFEFVLELVRHGFDIIKARKISDDLGLELWKDRKHVTKETVDNLNYLTHDEKAKLWALMSSQIDLWSVNERMNERLQKTLVPFTKTATDRESVAVMSARWPNNFMLRNKKVTGLESALQTYATTIDNCIYKVATMTDDNMIDLIRHMSGLASLMHVYNNDTRLLEGHAVMGRATLAILLLLALSLAHAAPTPTPTTAAPARALSDTELGGIVVGSLVGLCVCVCVFAWCCDPSITKHHTVCAQTSGACAALCSACCLA